MKNQKLKKSFRALPTMGMAFIVLGVLLLAASFAMNIKNNSMLYAGLFFILAGVAGYIYTIKKDEPTASTHPYLFSISRILCLSFRLINPGLAQSTCNPCHGY